MNEQARACEVLLKRAQARACEVLEGVPLTPPAHQPADMRLPVLREDIRLMPGAPTVTGAQTWLIRDSLAHRYYQIDIEAYEIVAAWAPCLTVGELQAAVLRDHGRIVPAADIVALTRFLDHAGLVVEAQGGWQAYQRRKGVETPGWLMWLIHNYLFIRIPLVRPEPFLRATLPFAAPIFTRAAAIAVALITALGLYLASRQWAEFATTFTNFLTLEGAAEFAIALTAVKALHELGHAYTALRFGARVPTMGVALLVMAPMLYTDVTDAWRLPNRRQRMAIDAAGVIVELALAGVATFLWAFLPHGDARGLAFVLATTSWVTSLAVNLSPLMRFDGYFLFADWVGIPNLQSRANALGRWQLRRLLLGVSEPCPDVLPARTRAWVIVYAWTIWVYRLVVFTGIALVVYHMFFKVLGIVLFAVEIGWFIVKPIGSELLEWWRRRAAIAVNPRAGVTAALALAALGSIVVPWSGRVAVPAILEPSTFARLYPVAPAQIKRVLVRSGETVAAGAVIAELDAPKLRHQMSLTATRIALLTLRRARRMADAKDKADSQAIETELALLEERRAGLDREVAELTVRSPIAGSITDLGPDIHPGRWVSRSDEIATVVGSGGLIARGYLAESDLWRVSAGTKGHFVFDNPLGTAAAIEVTSIATAGSAVLEIAELASVNGGGVAAREDKEHGLVPTEGAYLVRCSVDGALEARRDPGHIARGLITLAGAPESVLASVWRQVLKVLVRESGA